METPVASHSLSFEHVLLVLIMARILLPNHAMSNFEINHQEVTLIPVDANDRALLFSDVKIENVDSTYRTVTNAHGLTWKLIPGEYKAKIFLRNLQMKTVALRVTPGVSIYKLYLETGLETTQRTVPNQALFETSSVPATAGKKRRMQQRFPITFPVAYRTNTGDWVRSRSINFSTTGLCLENVGHINEEENIYVRLHVPICTVPIECPARVIWLKCKDVVRPLVGIQLYLTSNMRSSIDNWLSLIPR